MSAVNKGVALVVRAEPYGQRSARSQLDVALVAGALEQPLRLYFVGAAVLQLLAERDTRPASLPPGYRGWASLPELTRVRVFAEPAWMAWLGSRAADLLLQPEPLNEAGMRSDWRNCETVLVL